MPAAVIGGAIAAAGAVGSAVISSKGASNAAKATQAAADSSAAVQQQMYNQSAEALRPYQQAGLPATGAINALLGLPTTTAQAYGAPQAANYTEDMGNIGSGSWLDRIRQATQGGQPGNTGIVPPGTPNSTVPTQQQQYQTAFDNYRNSTGYQFRLNQGMNAINSGYAGAGTIKSGAAMKAINDYGQGMASQEFGNYLAALGNQQALGFSAASAQAGVGQNYANSMSNIYQNNGANQANAALVKSQNTANALSSVANMGGYLAGKYL